MKSRILLLSVATSLLAAGAQSASADLVLVGGSVNNGDFNADTSGADQRRFSETPDWQNIGTFGDPTFTRTNLDFDGTRNAQLDDESVGNVAGIAATGASGTYVIRLGDSYNISYQWRDAFNWDDATDQVGVTLFTTDDDLITGNRTILGSQILSGTSTLNSTYESVSQDSVYTATTADVGRALFVSFDGVDGGGTGLGFARLDNFTLTAVPEPGSLMLLGIAGCGMVLRRRKRQ